MDVYPLVMTLPVCELENVPVEIFDFPINSMVDLSIAVCMFTRGYQPFSDTACLMCNLTRWSTSSKLKHRQRSGVAFVGRARHSVATRQ